MTSKHHIAFKIINFNLIFPINFITLSLSPGGDGGCCRTRKFIQRKTPLLFLDKTHPTSKLHSTLYYTVPTSLSYLKLCTFNLPPSFTIFQHAIFSNINVALREELYVCLHMFMWVWCGGCFNFKIYIYNQIYIRSKTDYLHLQ